ncbi:MAG: hypothetical protein Q8R55_07685, partial [Candidatus Taylorbacteria bacterium]|nr:hypothetical protein [Candidatus Taylorbacteria bacterium]
SGGVVAWGIGSIIFAYYNLVLGIEVPSPGLADVVYVLSYPFWALGLINLGKGIGAGYKLRTPKGRVALVLVPILGFALTYFIFVTIAQGGEFDFGDAGAIKIFINIFFPLGDFVIITALGLIYSLSYRMFGGRFKWPINILLIGQFLLYCADSGFSYTAIQGTFYVANWVDLLFAHAMFLLAISVNALNIQGISSRVRDELVAFAPRASQAMNNLVLEIIQGQASIIGLVAWDVATKVSGLKVDIKNNSLSVEGDPKYVLQKLVEEYEKFFGSASLEICKEVTRKFLSQLSPEQIPDVLR